MGYDTAGTADIDSVIPGEYGGMWFFRDALDADRLGLTLVEYEPGASGKEHDHADEGHEEIYLVVAGEVEVDVAGDTVPLDAGEAIRVDPDTTRQLHNRGDERAEVVVAGAP